MGVCGEVEEGCELEDEVVVEVDERWVYVGWECVEESGE